MSEENKKVYSPLKYKQIKVKEILLIPIHVDKNLNYEIFIHNGIIYSGQRYGKTKKYEDPDMSDIAVEFYEILYGIKILNENNGIEFPGYAGDTMNSYKSVAKFALEDKRQEWYLRYHCLANFWLYPYKKTRRESKYPGRVSCNDSLDAYLSLHEVNIDQHYLSGYNPLWRGTKAEIKNHQNQYKNQADMVINKMIECIELRADNIVRDEKVCNELYDFFKEKKLL